MAKKYIIEGTIIDEDGNKEVTRVSGKTKLDTIDDFTSVTKRINIYDELRLWVQR